MNTTEPNPSAAPTLRTLTVQTCAPPAAGQSDSGNPASPSAATLDFLASDSTLDRCGESIDPAGWRLENYRRNPVFQNSHQYGDILFTIGRAIITEVRALPATEAGLPPSRGLFQRIQFATEINPMARLAHGLYQGGFLNAVSVGFIPLRWVDNPAPGVSRRFLEQELLEVSAVAIPANPGALQLALKAGAIARRDLREVKELLDFATRKTKQSVPIRSLSAHQLLAFAKQIRAALS